MRWWLHERRPSHLRHMNRAAFEIMYSKQDVARSQSTESASVKADSIAAGWGHVTQAIDELVACGCPRQLWPQVVSIAVPSQEQPNEHQEVHQETG